VSWGTFPTALVTEGGLIAFSAGPNTGMHIAALKCYLAIAIYCDFHSKQAALSLAELEWLTNCSRPMVVKGTQFLAAQGLLKIHRSGASNVYTLQGFAAKGHFSKVPWKLMHTQLRKLPDRGATALSALKILFVLLAFRDDVTNRASISHIKIRNYGGMKTGDVRAGIDHLVNHYLVHVSEDEDAIEEGRSAHSYTVLDGFYGKRPALQPRDEIRLAKQAGRAVTQRQRATVTTVQSNPAILAGPSSDWNPNDVPF